MARPDFLDPSTWGDPSAADAGPGWYWLSFCDADAPKGSQFLGVAIVHGRHFADAIRQAHLLRCNPGGEVSSWRLPDDDLPPLGLRNVLLDRRALLDADLITAKT